jgi:hypothetical protein
MSSKYLTVTIGPDYRLLPYFLRYYKTLGIEKFLVILNTPDDAPLKILQDFDLSPVKIWTEPFSETLKQRYERSIIDKYCSNDDWVIYSDLDEFHDYPAGLDYHLKYCEKHNIDFVEGRLLDRISETGELTILDETRPLEEQYPLGGYITNNLLKAWDKKIVAAKGKLIVGGGHHIFLDSATNNTLPYIRNFSDYSLGIKVHHFKWDRNVLDRMNRYIHLQDESLAYWVKEIRRFLDHYSKHNKINISDISFDITRVKNFINT